MDLTVMDIRIWDLLDILIVGYLIYQVYRLLRGTVAIYILIGVVLLYIVWWIVKTLHMDMLSAILSQFVGVGMILLTIIFQPELRKFLFYIGETAVHNRRLNNLHKWLPLLKNESIVQINYLDELTTALDKMRSRGEGALIVLCKNELPDNVYHSGVHVDAMVSSDILEAIFWKNSALHDGATIVQGNRISHARCVLPLSKNTNLPGNLGLRHRAALGLSERTDALVVILSEETGEISISRDGRLHRPVSLEEIEGYIQAWTTAEQS